MFEDVGMSPWQKQNNDGCFNLYTNNDATAVLSGGYPEKMKKRHTSPQATPHHLVSLLCSKHKKHEDKVQETSRIGQGTLLM